MTTIDSLSGQCLCGAVTFTATGVESDYHACHCPMCLRWGSAPFFGADVKSIEFDGEEHITRHDSSDWAQRGFCKRCGGNLFYFLKPASSYSVCVGAFDDQSQFKLASEIFVDHQPAGYSFSGNLPRQTEAEVLAAFGATIE